MPSVPCALREAVSRPSINASDPEGMEPRANVRNESNALYSSRSDISAKVIHELRPLLLSFGTSSNTKRQRGKDDALASGEDFPYVVLSQ